MITQPTDYSHAQLVDALYAEYVARLEDADELATMSLDSYHDYIKSLTHSELITETGCDEVLTISDFMHAWT